MNQKKLQLMSAGGRHLAQIKAKLIPSIKPGVSLIAINTLADKLISSFGDYPSFKTVKNYHYATCINLNQGIVHGIPDNTIIKPGDLVSLDIGLIHKGYHLDTAISLQVPPHNPQVTKFLKVGQAALKKAIAAVSPGSTVYQVSQAIEKEIKKNHYSVIRDLTGHGIGRRLHQPPSIPCFTSPQSPTEILKPGQALAIEVMYTLGDYHLETAPDNWTLQTRDHSLAAIFEDTVITTLSGNQVLT